MKRCVCVLKTRLEFTHNLNGAVYKGNRWLFYYYYKRTGSCKQFNQSPNVVWRVIRARETHRVTRVGVGVRGVRGG